MINNQKSTEKVAKELDILKDLIASNTYQPEPQLASIKELATILNISESCANHLNSSGKLPMPVKIGKSNKWRINELTDWINAGAPARQRWETEKRKFGYN